MDDFSLCKVISIKYGKRIPKITFLGSNVQSEFGLMVARHEVYFWTNFYLLQQLVNKNFSKIDICMFRSAKSSARMRFYVECFFHFGLVAFSYRYVTNSATL